MRLDNILSPRSQSFFALQVIWGSLVSAVAYLLSLRARNSMNFKPICKILVYKIFNRFARFWSIKSLKILGTRLPFQEPVHAIVIFQYLIKRRTIFLRHPCMITCLDKIFNGIFQQDSE